MKANLVLSSLHHASNSSSFEKIQLSAIFELKGIESLLPPKALSEILQIHQLAGRE